MGLFSLTPLPMIGLNSLDLCNLPSGLRLSAMVGVNHLSIRSFMDCQTVSHELKMSLQMSL